jgi:hypothetical protein
MHMKFNYGTENTIRRGVILFALLAAPTLSRAQTAAIVGYPANFDAYNNTGSPVYGFEIEADGIQPNDVTRVFGGSAPGCYIRYCTGAIVPFSGGVYIRWMSPYDPNTGQFTLSTPIPNGTVATGESCWTLGLGARYAAAGCEHFGISTLRNPTAVVYRWLVPDPNNPGSLTYYTGPTTPGAPPPPPIPVPIPQPVINVLPPAQVGGAPAVDFALPVAPAPAPAQFGPAQWVKVYHLDQAGEVDLNDLMGGNPAVPEAPAPAEMEWKLLQTNPHSANSGVLHNQAQLAKGNHAVVRRYEYYQYTGKFDPLTHEALCADITCTAPGPGELGNIIGAQNAAANLEIPSITVTKVGSGTVGGAGGAINCGGSCTASFAAGASETLTANPPSNGVFNGWSGACSGNGACNLTVNGAVNVTATFTTVYTLSIGRGGSGTVTGDAGGEFGTSINCGGSCSAKFQQGKTVTLTAAPSAGSAFTGWSGACAGTSLTCAVTITSDTKVQANFK